eukprot:CAMPEP_0202389444 /NCGR_PEP_ID=MMETSP1127-20130417/82975_1 /ASSEMBLY_ACC=CAM_ASM_000462 /TAXON_ID=3047 /ORGANISM="Dunaliella tertiolecta, Strain CCMP1320" /LENGTH=48 /DNA_ID= /DNA_START= /DNA_END= /DNA_ORIENTATION=
MAAALGHGQNWWSWVRVEGLVACAVHDLEAAPPLSTLQNQTPSSAAAA